MRTLNRYIAGLYTWNVLVLLLVIFALVVVVDLFVNLEEFSRAAGEIAETSDGAGSGLRHALLTSMLVIDLWWPRILQLFNYLVGVVLVTAMGFTCWQLVRHREFVAMLSSGISLHRAMRPLMIVGLVFIVIAGLNQELIIPRIAHLLNRDPRNSGQRAPVAFSIPLTPDGAGHVFLAREFDDEHERMLLVHVWSADEQGRLTSMTRADEADWDGSAWVLRNQGAEGTVARVESPLDPMQFRVRHVRGFGQNLSWRQISRMLEQPGLPDTDRERLQRARWGRFGGLISAYLTLIVAIPFFLRRSPGPMLGPSLKAAPVCVLGLAAGAASSAAIFPGLPIWLGAFIPCLILAPFAIALTSGVKS
ncbi:MAG: LptF/LptG family permease [Phycisphaerales bacterium]|nr:LptF/LptG family permease [Phycisphaerales bacterium]